VAKVHRDEEEADKHYVGGDAALGYDSTYIGSQN